MIGHPDAEVALAPRCSRSAIHCVALAGTCGTVVISGRWRWAISWAYPTWAVSSGGAKGGCWYAFIAAIDMNATTIAPSPHQAATARMGRAAGGIPDNLGARAQPAPPRPWSV